jgi:hypothetical protein
MILAVRTVNYVLQHNDTNQIKTRKKLQMDSQPTNECKRALHREMRNLCEQLICIARMFTQLYRDYLTTVNVGLYFASGSNLGWHRANIRILLYYYLSLQTNKKCVHGSVMNYPTSEAGGSGRRKCHFDPDGTTCPRNAPQAS